MLNHNYKTILNLFPDNRIHCVGTQLINVLQNNQIEIDLSSLPAGNLYDYLYIDGEFIYSPLVVDNTIPDAQAEIAALKKQLSDTDYQAIKYAEGWYTEEEYESIKAQRQEWRNRINELELVIIEAQIQAE